MNKFSLIFALLTMVCTAVSAQSEDSLARREVLLETTMGNIRLELYNETPNHRDNFLKLVAEGYYDGNLWHRVIGDFMIQTGDSTSRHAEPGMSVGNYSPDYTIPAEFVFPKYFQKRGALAAAREGDSVNPERASSSAQFYIVVGKTFSDMALDHYQERIDKATNGTVKLTDEIRDFYRKIGGPPWLDGQYTIWGNVVSGMEFVDMLKKGQGQSGMVAAPADEIISLTVISDL